MRIVEKISLPTQPLVVLVEHEGDSRQFQVSVFGRRSFVDGHVFEQINAYWAGLPKQKQAEIFDYYVKADLAFTNTDNNTELETELTEICRDLLDAHPYSEMRYWVDFQSNITIPSTFEAEFITKQDDNRTRERTYLASDYRQFVTMSLILRCVVPIWGEYTKNIKEGISTEDKEKEAFNLIKLSEIYRSEPMMFLQRLISHVCSGKKSDPADIINNGGTTEDFDYRTLALVCFRRVCVCDIRGRSDVSDGTRVIYKFLIQRTSMFNTDPGSLVKDKPPVSEAGSDDTRATALERYKVTTTLSMGDRVHLEHSVSDPIRVAKQLCCMIDENLLRRSIESAQELINHNLMNSQVLLLRWVMARVIAPEGISYLQKNAVVNLIGVAEAVLWTYGHQYLAVLISSRAFSSENAVIISAVDSNMRIPKEILDDLKSLYPYERREPSRRGENRDASPVIEAISKLTKDFAQNAWRPTANPEMLLELLKTPRRSLPIPPNLKIAIARLVVEIGKQTWA